MKRSQLLPSLALVVLGVSRAALSQSVQAPAPAPQEDDLSAWAAPSHSVIEGPADDAPAVEFSLGIGYAHVGVGGSDSVLESEDALRFDPVLSFSPLAKLPQLRLGASVGATMVLDNSQRTIISSGGLVIVGHSDVPLFLIEPEIRLSWRQSFNDGEFYIEPGIAAGGVFGQLSVDAEDTASGQSFEEWDSTFAARVFLNVGARVTGGLAGIQASYMRGGDLHFADNASGDVEEFYIGIFGSLRF